MNDLRLGALTSDVVRVVQSFGRILERARQRSAIAA
jgi:hypothetical protein